MSGNTFAPRDGATVAISASTTSADEAITSGTYQLRIVNPTAVVAFVKTGEGSALTATSADFPVAGGESVIIRKPSNHNIVAVILASSTGTVYVTPGEGGVSA